MSNQVSGDSSERLQVSNCWCLHPACEFFWWEFQVWSIQHKITPSHRGRSIQSVVRTVEHCAQHSLGVDILRNTFTSRSGWRFDPCHNPVQYPDLCDVLKRCAWSQHGKVLDVEMLGAVSEHRHVSCARMIQTKKCLCRIPSLSWHSHWQHRSTVRRPFPIHGFVQNGIPTLALVVFTWHLDHG